MTLMHDDDTEFQAALASGALAALDHLLGLGAPDDTITFREIAAQVRLIKQACPCQRRCAAAASCVD